MKSSHGSVLSNRVLRINVGFLLSDGPGNSHTSEFDIPDPVRVSPDLVLTSLKGSLRLSRMKEGILVQSELDAPVHVECTRCSDMIDRTYHITLEELYAHPRPLDESEFYIGQDAILDLAPLIRAELLIKMGQKVVCDETYQDRCPLYGMTRTYAIGGEDVIEEIEDDIDPRMAKLKQLLDREE